MGDRSTLAWPTCYSSTGPPSFAWLGWSAGRAIASKSFNAKLKKRSRWKRCWKETDRDELPHRCLHRNLGNSRNLPDDSGTEVFEDSARNKESEKISTQHSALSQSKGRMVRGEMRL